MKKYLTDIKNNIIHKEITIKENKFKYHERNVIKRYDKEITNFLGMGGAITEASAINYSKLSSENKEKFLNDYYSSSGLNYNFARISIGSNDFSVKHFEYSKKKDLSDFSISHDMEYIIPLIKDTLEKKELNIIASPWSPPVMYKTIKTPYLGTKLRKDYYEDYSKFLIKFLSEYKKIGINIQYLTMQNEPLARQPWESCKFSLDEQKDFIYNHLLDKLDDTKLLLWDHNKEMLYDNFKYLYLKNKKIAGIGFHYYTGRHFNNIKLIHDEYPDALLVNTEMCCGFSKYNEINWIKDAETYLIDIIGDLNNGVNAYLDWNILLNEHGGPNHLFNYCKSPIILNGDNYIKTPIYYYLYHISHFIDNGRITYNSSYTSDLHILSIKNDNKIVIVIMNNKDRDYKYNLYINDIYIKDEIRAHTVITYEKDL